MASVYQSEKTGIFHIMVRLGGKQFHKSLDTDQERKANAILATVEETKRTGSSEGCSGGVAQRPIK